MGMKCVNGVNAVIFKLSWWFFKYRLWQTNRFLKKMEQEIVSRETKKRNECARVQDVLSSKMDADALANQNPVPRIPRAYSKKAR